MPLRLYAVTLAEGTDALTALPEKIEMVVVRDLAAAVRPHHAFTLDPNPDAEVETHRKVVDTLFRRAQVLPAPVGTLFRSEDILKRWLELHYQSLAGALDFVEDRVVARVHVCTAESCTDDELGSGVAESAAEAFRVFRRRAVATVPLRLEHITGIVLSGAFLVDRSLWGEFTAAVEQERTKEDLRFELTGPWAPYDFVNMQFG